MKYKKKDHGENPPLFKGYPIIGLLLSRDNWMRLLPSNFVVKLADDEKEDKIIIDYVPGKKKK